MVWIQLGGEPSVESPGLHIRLEAEVELMDDKILVQVRLLKRAFVEVSEGEYQVGDEM